MSKTKLYICGTLILIIFNFLGYYSENDYIRNFFSSLTITWFIWLTWDFILWQLLAGKLGIPRKISGRWRGNLKSSYCDNMEKTIEVLIKQTFSNVQIDIKTDQITSRSICFHWEKGSELFPRLFYIYQTQTEAFGDINNMPQYGGGILSVKNKDILTITYWTSRETTGKIELKKISSHI